MQHERGSAAGVLIATIAVVGIAALVAMTLIIVAGLGSDDPGDPAAADKTTTTTRRVTTTTTRPATSTTTTTTSAPSRGIGENDKQVSGSLSGWVEAVGLSEGDDFFSPSEDTKWVAVSFVVENIGTEEQSLLSWLMWTLRSVDGRTFDYAPVGSGLDGDLLPGKFLRGDIVFQVPPDLTEAELFWNGDVYGLTAETVFWTIPIP
jgi:hypothetical protein